MNTRQVALIHHLQGAAEARGFPIWVESGWAVDGRLGRETREHGDIDFAIPAERMEVFKALLLAAGAGKTVPTDYGFIVQVDGITVDCEPCHLLNGVYELEGGPPGSCPMEKEGTIGDVGVRCTSWQAILWEYFYYLLEVPYRDWPLKDRESYLQVRAVVGESQAAAWHADFLVR
jgi:2''-aminoglycoside nucleotidyltransferase